MKVKRPWFDCQIALKLNLREFIGEFRTIPAYNTFKFDRLFKGVDQTMLDLTVSCESPFSDLGKMAVTTVKSPTKQGQGLVTVAVAEGGYRVQQPGCSSCLEVTPVTYSNM